MNSQFPVVRKILDHHNWFVLPAILVLYLSSAILMLLGMVKLYYTVTDIYENMRNPEIMDESAMISAHFLGIIETYILSITLFILALSLYKLFVGNYTLAKLSWVKVENINDLKSNLSKMTVLFLCIMVVQKITEWKNPLDTLYLGIIVATISGVLIWFSKHLDTTRK
ncbi:MAG TPA: YqhA family protein [Bacteroidia bacterium]|jgi:uncharacterized membrane protein YqhA|nr:YqhA family protein [Bacteroidia bacterium]